MAGTEENKKRDELVNHLFSCSPLYMYIYPIVFHLFMHACPSKTSYSYMYHHEPRGGAYVRRLRHSYHVISIKRVAFNVADSAFYNIHMIGMSWLPHACRTSSDCERTGMIGKWSSVKLECLNCRTLVVNRSYSHIYNLTENILDLIQTGNMQLHATQSSALTHCF